MSLTLIHFREWIWCEVKNRVSFYYTDNQLFQHHLLKRFLFPYWIILAPLLKFNSISGVSVCSIHFYVFLTPIPYCHAYWIFLLNVEINNVSDLNLIFIFKVLCYFRSFAFHYKPLNQLVDFFKIVKILIGLYWICWLIWGGLNSNLLLLRYRNRVDFAYLPCTLKLAY